MKVSVLLPIFLSVFILGCNSQPTPTSHYYMLNQQLKAENLSGISPIKEIQLNLPDYLKQPNLVLQLSEHELSYAYYHTWAESLDQAITKAIQSDLKGLDNAQKQLAREKAATILKANLHLNIDHFYATINSKVVLAGSYILVNTEGTKALSPQYSFSFKADIEANGYPHSVAKMRYLINDLAQEIYIKYQAINPIQK